MKRLFTVIFLPFLLGALITEPVIATKRRNVAHDMNASVLLHMKGVTLGRDLKLHKVLLECSGTYIDRTHILTAAHCFEDYAPVNIWARGPNELIGYPVHLVKLMGTKDLALLEAPFPHPFVKIGKAPRVGALVWNIGSPYDFEFVLSEGIVGLPYYRVLGFTADYFVTTAMINPGSSGGGCFNKRGELIGVNTMSVGFGGWGGLSIAVGTETIKEFLR